MSDWRKYFPYQPRFAQDKIADFVSRIIADKKTGIVEAPYGIGKTITMLSCGLAEIENRSENKNKIVFATCDHAVQETIVKEVLNLNKEMDKKLLIVSIIGKKNMCPYLEKFDYDVCDYEKNHERCPFYNKTYSKRGYKEHSILTEGVIKELINLVKETPEFFEKISFVDFVIESCKEKELCPYEIMLEIASEANIIVLDYYHVFTPILLILEKKFLSPEKTILFVDEADRLQSRLIDILSRGITDFGIYKLKRQIRKLVDKKINNAEEISISEEEYNFFLKFYNSLNDFFRLKLEQVKQSRKSKNDKDYSKGDKEEIYIDVSKQEFIDFLEKSLEESFMETTSKIARIIEKMLESGKYKKLASRPDKFLSAWGNFSENFFGYCFFSDLKQVVALSPYELASTILIESKRYSLQDIIKEFYSTIFFSATIGNPEIFSQTLGINNTEFFSSKEFNTQRYSVLLKKDISSVYKQREQNVKKAIEDIKILNEKFKSLLLAFPSYECSKEIISNSELNLKHISELTKHDTNSIYWVVLGGKGSRGINKAAMLPCVYVFGLQLPKPNDYLFQKRKTYLIKKYPKEKALQLIYNNVVNQSCQVAGRIFREIDKKGMVILADKRYKYDFMLRDFFYNCIPSYFKVRLKEVVQEEFEKEIDEFINL